LLWFLRKPAKSNNMYECFSNSVLILWYYKAYLYNMVIMHIFLYIKLYSVTTVTILAMNVGSILHYQPNKSNHGTVNLYLLK
jgi:hypothetical protein